MAVTLGSLLARIEPKREGDERFTFLMPDSDGPCRFGVYKNLFRLVLDRLGWGDRVRIWSPPFGDYFHGQPAGFKAIAFAGICAAGVLNEALHDVRPVETRGGSADSLYAKWSDRLCRRIEEAAAGDLSLPRTLMEISTGHIWGIPALLRQATTEFSAVKGRKDIPNVLVVGEIRAGIERLRRREPQRARAFDEWLEMLESDYAEAALRHGVDTPRWREVDPAAASVLDRYRREDPRGFTPQVVLGGSWTRNYTDEDAFTVGAEYFYDDTGYDSGRLYPVLLAVPVAGRLLGDPALAGQQPFTPFYLGRHYAGVFATLPKPGPWNDTTLTLSVLGNLSDGSFEARLDHSVLALTYLRVETFVAGHLGHEGGELRLGFDVPPQPLGPNVYTPRFVLPAPVLEAGVALRVSL